MTATRIARLPCGCVVLCDSDGPCCCLDPCPRYPDFRHEQVSKTAHAIRNRRSAERCRQRDRRQQRKEG